MRIGFNRRLMGIASSLGMAVTTFLPIAAASDPPANDSFQSPEIVASLPFADEVDISSATSELVDSTTCPSDRTIWYDVTFPVNKPVVVETIGTPFATHITIFQGDLPAPVAGTCRTASSYPFTPTGSGRYRVRIGTQAVDPQGLLKLNIYELGSVSGRVIDEEGNPLEGIEVDLYDPDNNYSEDPENYYSTWTYTDADGRYKFVSVPRGYYRLLFVDYSETYIHSWYPSSPDESTAQTFEITNGPFTPQDQVMLRGAVISGTLGFADGTGVDGCIYAIDSRGWFVSAGYASQGTFGISGLAAGSYRLQVMENCSGIAYGSYNLEWYQNAGNLASATPIEVATGQHLAGLEIVIDPSPAPTNDERENAIPLTDLPIHIEQGLARATSSPSDTTSCGIVGRTVWYSYTPSEAEQIYLGTYGHIATAALHAQQTDGSLSPVGCANPSYWSPRRFSVEAGTQYLIQVGATSHTEPAGLSMSLFDTDGGGTLHFDPPNPCHLQCPYWNRERTAEQKNEDACAPIPASNEGSWEDHLIEVPSTINGKVPHSVGFAMDPTVDHDVWFCRVEPDSNGKYLVRYSANSPTARCDHGLPFGCSESFEASVVPGKQYIIRVYNWSDPAPVEGAYWYLARKA